MIKRVWLTIFILFMSVCSGFTVSNRGAGVSDTTSFEIQAVIQGKPVDSGNVDDDPVPYNQLIIRDLYTGDQNLVTGSEVNIGRGDRLFGEDYVDLFVVEYTSNNLAPVNIGIEIDPFTYEYKDESGQTQALVIPMSLKRHAGLRFSSSLVADLLTGGDEIVVYPVYSSVDIPELGDNNSITGPHTEDGLEKPSMQAVIGGESYIEDKFGKKTINSSTGYATSIIEDLKATDKVGDEYKFSYLINYPEGWYFTYDTKEGIFIDDYSNYRWEYNHNKKESKDGSSDYYINTGYGYGYVTNYVTYSLMLDEPPESGEYRMNVTVTLNAEA